MKCPKCKTPLRKGSKFCPKCGAKVKHTARNIFLIVLAVALLLGGAGVTGWKLGLFQTSGDDNDENFVLLSGSFTDRLIVDQASALAAIGDVADVLGIENVNAEFSDCKVDTVSGNTYYRFYQEYEGMPVYGRSVIVVADKNGDGLALAGNYFDVGGINTFPRTDEASAIEAAREYYGEDATIISEGLVIYSLQDHTPESAWELCIASDNTIEYCFVSAASGNVLAQNSLVYTETAIGYGEDIDGEEKNFNAKVEDDKVLLEDEDKNIHIFNANEETLLVDFSLANDIYSCNLSIHPENSAEISLAPVVNVDSVWEDSKAVTSITRAAAIYDFYKEVLNRNGFNGENGELNIVYNDYKDGDITNAYSTGGKSKQVTLISFAVNNSMSYDTFGHEFTHSVEQSISGMQYSGESGALMEAYSDIFGELFEDWQQDGELNGNCDWIHDGIRNLISPMSIEHQVCYYEYNGETCPLKEKGGKHVANSSLTLNEGLFAACQVMRPAYPDYYQGTAWHDITPKYDENGETTNDYGGIHTNNTVISHAAYLMYTGIGGNPNCQALSTEDLARLFYETLYTLPSDCTFGQFRTLVENTADIMCQQGSLTEKQRLCVSNAFFRVGIAPTTMPVAKELTLDVYGVDGLPYDDYTLYVRYYSGAEKTYTSETIMKEGIYFPAIGSYELCIIDNANTDNQTSITVKVVDHGGATELPVFTQCGLSKIDGPITASSSGNSTPLEAYMEAANRTTATGSWTEEMNMTASMVLKNGSSSTKTKATMEASVDIEGWNGTDTSSLYMSGSASMSVLNQTIAYTMTWQNGTAHYEYTKPTVTSADLKIDPSYFNFNSLTDDMIISSAINGNQITFSIQGDALTKAGISAVNSLLSSVENLSYDDATVDVTVNEQSGKIDTLTMTFYASMTYQGYNVEADYEIQYEFSEHDGAEKSEGFSEPAIYSESYKATLGQYPIYTEQPWGKEYTEYTLYDINKDEIPELIIRFPDTLEHIFYTYNNGKCVLCGELWDSLLGGYIELFEYDGNGIVIHNGGMGSMRIESVYVQQLNDNALNYGSAIASTEDISFDDLYSILEALTPLNNFHHIDDLEWIDFSSTSTVETVVSASNITAINTSYLEDLPYDAWDRYTGNEGDSFIEKVGTRNSSTDINGVGYSHGLECWVARWNYKNETSWVWKEWALNKSYSTIQGEITVSDDCYNKNNYMTNIAFVGDGETLCSYTLTPGTNYPIAFSIDISQVETLRISVEDDGSFSGGTSFILGNITLV